MIDNRPKAHPRKKTPEPEPHMLDAIPPAIHSMPPAEPQVQTAAVHAPAKSIPVLPLAGLGSVLGGNIGGALPIVLIANALQRGRGSQSRPVVRQQAAPAAPVEAASAPAVAVSTIKPVTGKPSAQKTANAFAAKTAALPAPKAEQAAFAAPPVIPVAPRPIVPPRPAPKPAEIRNLLSDLSGYLPGTGSVHASRISKIIGIADELKSLDSVGSVSAASLPANPLDRHIGVLNALSRNLPVSGASNLGKASQVLSLVSTLSSGNARQNPLGALGSMGGLGNMGGLGSVAGLGNMAGMLRNAMSQPQNPVPEPKNITPAQQDGLKDTVNRLLSGMDDKQKSELLDKAKSFLGK